MLYGNIHTWPSQAVIECLVMENTVVTKTLMQHIINITFYKSTCPQNSITGKTLPGTYYGLEKRWKHRFLAHIKCLMRKFECRVQILEHIGKYWDQRPQEISL